MKKILLLFLLFPFFMQAQEKPADVSAEEVQNIYDSLPKENGVIQWHGEVKLDSSYTKSILSDNAEAVFARILRNGREITRTDGNKEGKISGIGTFVIDGGSQYNYFNSKAESREVDFSVELTFKDGAYSYKIFEVTSIRNIKTDRMNYGTYGSGSIRQTDFDQVTLEKAFQLCSKSGSKKIERRLFAQTIEKLQDNIALLNVLMKKHV